MDKFEGKVRDALDKLEEDGVIESRPLIDPFMQEESPEALEKKKTLWNDIFHQYPEFADALLKVFEGKTEKSFNTLIDSFKNILNLM